MALSADGQWAFTGSSDKYVKLWSTSDGSTRFEERLATRVNHVTLNKTASLGFAIDSVDDRVFFDLANKKSYQKWPHTLTLLNSPHRNLLIKINGY